MRNLCLVLLGAVLVSCASTELSPAAAAILVSPNPAPQGCKYVGQVIGNQGNSFTGGFTSNANMEQGAMNDLRNKAANLGANYVQLMTNRAGSTGSWNKHGGSQEQTNVTDLGNAYICNKLP